MGKRQHQKDKLYLTCTEWTYLYGGRRPNADQEEINNQFRRLRFDHCSLSLQPFTHPYCTTNGVVYDLANIVPFLKKYGVDPATGQKLDAKSLIKLNFHKNNDGHYHCPVLFKVFNENSHIVAIKTTGNVFSYEAVEQLNLKPKHFKDLLTDEPFTKQDIITLQDPHNLDRFNVANFYHVKFQLKWNDDDDEDSSSANKNLRVVNHETRATLDELNRNQEQAKQNEPKTVPQSTTKADKFNSAHYSTGMVAAGFTSTVMEPKTKLEPAVLDHDIVKYRRVNKKGYVKIETNFGSLNLELYCDQVPKTCDNFLRLCRQGYYDNTIFHRLIKNFMVQGGDPTGTGSGGQSVFGKPFEDEFKPHLSHSGRGVLSMANSGPNSNKSQFFITFRSCKHLDKKHTIFGRLVGGMETLDKIERIKTDNKDKPIEVIKILQAIIYVDPFKEIEDEILKEREKLEKEAQNNERKSKKPEIKKPFRQGVGSFIDLNLIKNIPENDDIKPSNKKLKQENKKSFFGDFSSW